MSWPNLKELIFQERKILDSTGALDLYQDSAFETQHSALLGAYLKSKSAVDSAVRHFAQTLEWPELSSQERFFLIARLDFAWEIVSVLNTTHDGERLISFPSPERTKTSDILEGLLLEIWPYGCGRFLQTQKWIAEQAMAPQPMPARGQPDPVKVECVA
jgi:hypothetical protein